MINPGMPIRGSMRAGRRIGAGVVAAIAALACLLIAEAATSGAIPTNSSVKKGLKRQLKKRGYKHIRASGCNNNHTRFICRWYAHGRWPGNVPYKCREKARFLIHGKEWLIPACTNRLTKEIPLNPQLGPQPALFGANDGFVAKTSMIDELPGLGANVGRTQLTWASVEYQPGQYEWAPYDQTYARMLADGIRPLFLLYGAPCWDQPDPGHCNSEHPSANHFSDFAHFAQLAVRRYPLAAGFEVWNEPSNDRFWGTDVDPGQYADMLKTVAPAIHAVNPGMNVVSGGLASSLSDDSDGLSTETFLRRLFDKGALNDVDAIGIHVYPHKAFHKDYLGNVRIRLAQILDVLQENNAASTPLWVTEYGVSMSGKDDYTEGQQASALVNIYQLFRRVQGLNIPAVVVHRFRDTGPKASGESGFGITEENGKRKRAYCDLAHARGVPCG